MALVHETPGKLFESKERWFKIFTNLSLISSLIACVPGFFVFFICRLFGFMVPGIIIWVLIVAAVFAVTTIKRNAAARTYSGGGLFLYQIIMRKRHCKKQRCLYVKNYDRYVKRGDFIELD